MSSAPPSDAPLGRLRRLAQRSPAPSVTAAQEQCELCSEPIPPEHRHLLDLSAQRLLCACRACSILFDRRAAGGGHYRLVPDRVRYLSDFDLDEPLWERFRIPVEMAFFFRSSAAGRVVAFYPSPAGATESLLDLEAWDELERRNPVVSEVEPDVEALLVNRARGAQDHWLVPVDRCYALVGLMRTRWQGLSGGEPLWEELERFFDALRREARA